MNKTILLLAMASLAVGSAMPTRAQTKQAAVASNHTPVPTSEKASPGAGPRTERADPEEFVIGTGDVLAVNVWKEAEISKVVPVRSDGRISLPLIGELRAGGQTPRQLEAEITKKLKDFVADPEVTVVVQEIKSQKFNVLG